MRVLVIGGTRFIGRQAVVELATLGHAVTVFHRGRSETVLPPEVRHIRGDRDDLDGFAAEFRRDRPDVALDMRLFTVPEAQAAVRVFQGVAPRLVVVSSIDVYRAYGRLHGTEPGPPDAVPLTEDAPIRERPSVEGDRSDKPGVERVVMRSRDPVGTVLRLPAVYGPGDFQHRLYPYARRILDGRRPVVLEENFARWRFSHGYVEDVASALVLAVTNPRAAGRVYNVGPSETPPMAEWIRQVGRSVGWDFDVTALPASRLPAHLVEPIDTRQHWVVDTARIREELGYRERVPVEDGLRRTLGWEQSHPPKSADAAMFDYAAEDAALAAGRASRR